MDSYFQNSTQCYVTQTMHTYHNYCALQQNYEQFANNCSEDREYGHRARFPLKGCTPIKVSFEMLHHFYTLGCSGTKQAL